MKVLLPFSLSYLFMAIDVLLRLDVEERRRLLTILDLEVFVDELAPTLVIINTWG